jgi:prepilin-type N-terminal cleavage/methylation domain-containing protein
MDFKIISFSKKRRAAMTMIEVLIALSIASLIMVALGMLTVHTSRSFLALGNYVELDRNSRNTLDRMTQIIREADGVMSWQNHEIVLSYHSKPISFTYSPTDKNLVMADASGTKKVLLEGCDFFDFQIFQRTSMSGVYDQYPITADEAATKIVQVSWVCSKSLIGKLINSESVQSAKIVIRKQ